MTDLIVLSLKNVFRKGLRSVLTVMGIAVGVASVVLISTAGAAGSAAVNKELDSLGLNGITVSAKGENSLSGDDIDTIKSLDDVTGAMPIITQSAEVRAYDNECEAMVWGIAEGREQVISLEVIHGKSFSVCDIDAAENVCMIDRRVSRALFGRDNCVGKDIMIPVGGAYERFRVVGVTKADSSIMQSLMGEMVPDFVYIPYSTMNRMLGVSRIKQVAVKLRENCDISEASGRVSAALEQSIGSADSIKTENLSAQRDKLNNLMSIISAVLSVIGAISLLVAGLGIMTVMLVSVNERTREIGIKKAIGAGFSKIMTEFLLEALTISAAGSIIGAILGVSAALVGAKISGMSVSIDFMGVAAVSLCAVVTGALFGVYPAYKAARLKPIDALRYE